MCILNVINDEIFLKKNKKCNLWKIIVLQVEKNISGCAVIRKNIQTLLANSSFMLIIIIIIRIIIFLQQRVISCLIPYLVPTFPGRQTLNSNHA